VTYTLTSNVENLSLTGTGDISGKGNSLANIVTGNGSQNTLDGASGNDILKAAPATTG
jgi:Ca2+-binding RTX toxin-like protein